MKNDLEALNSRIRKTIRKSSGLFPQEASPTSDAMSTTPKSQQMTRTLRPNNFRRFIKIQTLTFLNPTTIVSGIESATGTTISGQRIKNLRCSQSPHNKIITIHNFYNCIIQITSKGKLTAIRPQYIVDGKKESYSKSGTLKEVQIWLVSIINSWKDEQELAINKFLDVFPRLRIKGELIHLQKRGEEVEILGDAFIDTIPDSSSFYCNVGKKVYDKGFEFTNPKMGESSVPNIVRYLENQSLKAHLPAISDELGEIKGLLKELVGANVDTANNMKNIANDFVTLSQGSSELAVNMQTHVGIMKGIRSGIDNFSSSINNFNNVFNKGEIILPPKKENEDTLNAIKQNLKCLDDIEKFQSLIKSLSPNQLTNFQCWLFERFGI